MMNKMKLHVDLKEDFDKLSTEEHAEIVMMCLRRLCHKAEELQDVFIQLVKTYGIEMSTCDASMIIQISSPMFNNVLFNSILGTKEGIKHALLTLKDRITKQVSDIEKEESNAKE